MRRLIILLLGFGMLLTGCSNKTNVKEVEVYKAEDIPFKDGSGRVTISFESAMLDDGGAIIDGIIDVIVLAKGLKSTANYEISLKGDNNHGVVFGPKENVELRFGTMVGETSFQPNQQGELFVSMKNPVRIISKAKEVQVVVSEDGKEVLGTDPFILSKKISNR
ncbi:hypothetical protein D1B31_01365 [Neobacillus notoginsengisoli]|uniref:Uncharacterized protein n=1 Tax=Neobacillus notoginsengisoli TaxID=1578198 RepID=A0A417YZR5_9BACI|nr:hypothetical protein [Neobacillus notoginsengisoli]RHW43345.1 hypothetical protein D1B31_01365 [Neobacillus notoginsengisoli]